jgi:hypothetical protein
MTVLWRSEFIGGDLQTFRVLWRKEFVNETAYSDLGNHTELFDAKWK